MAQLARRQHHQVAPLEEFREEAVACPDCGGPATRRTRMDGKSVSFLQDLVEGVACPRCTTRSQAVAEVRGAGAPSNPTNARARELVRDVEFLAAQAADASLPDEERAVARGLLAAAFPPSSLELERIRQLRLDQEASAAAARAAKPGLSDAEVQQLVERHGTDEDGSRLSSRVLCAKLRELGKPVDRDRVLKVLRTRPK